MPISKTTGKESAHGSTRRGAKKTHAPDVESIVRFQETLRLRSLADATQAEYLRFVRKLAARCGGDPAALDEPQVRAHLLHLKDEHHYSASSMRTAVAAMRAFYGLHLGRGWKLFDLVRSPSAQKLPVVLTRAEVARLFAVIRAPRFRTLFRLIYACGLRIGEAVTLEVRDLREPGRIHLREAKGNKERCVPLPERMREELRAFWKTHRHPRWLFPGVGRGWREQPERVAQLSAAVEPMGVGSVQHCLRLARAEAGLSAGTVVHTLRHSYATHLLEEGVSIRLPEPLRFAFAARPELLHDLLFAQSAAALQSIAAIPRHLGGELGIIGVLHTWGRQLQHHPHVHCIVPGGALSADRRKWRPARAGGTWLLPGDAVAAVMRRGFDEALRAAAPDLHAHVPDSVWREGWWVHTQPAGSGQAVVRYLARYVQRTAISDERLLAATDEAVTFTFTDPTTGARRECTLSAPEFLRRYLQHVLPPGQHRVRYFGWLHPAAKARRAVVETLLAVVIIVRAKVDAPPWHLRCPHCAQFTLVRVGSLPRGPPTCQR